MDPIGFFQTGIVSIAANPASTTEGELKLMMQSMLVDRFKLQIHRETRPLSGYALLVSSKGPKLEVGHCEDTIHSGLDGRPGRILSFNMPISSLAVLSGGLGGPVVDETGLNGCFNYKLVWTPDQSDVFWRNPPPPDVLRQLAIDPNGPSIFTAIQEQLGLRLEARKVPTEVLLIDSVQKPSEN